MIENAGRDSKAETVFFVGVGGTGMNVLARWAASRGIRVLGSDREFDRGLRPAYYETLQQCGVTILPQDGTGISEVITRVVTSTAIEANIPDIQQAIALGIPIVHRSEELENQLKDYKSIAIGGTSGKTTVTAMAGWVLMKCGIDPTIVNGAPFASDIPGIAGQDFVSGSSDWAVFEADESDGSIARFFPQIGLIHNISKDHKPIPELIDLFNTFISNVQGQVIINCDDYRVRALNFKEISPITYGFENKADYRGSQFQQLSWGNRFFVNNQPVELSTPGFHNALNALATYSIAHSLKIPHDSIAQALLTFPGSYRRFQKIPAIGDIVLVDDYAHNPDKIAASLRTAQSLSTHVIAMFQPHGFGPTRFMFNELVDVFSGHMRSTDNLVILPIFYAGGTAQRDISSEMLQTALHEKGCTSTVCHRNDIPEFVRSHMSSDSLVIVMGARDPSLTGVTLSIRDALTN